MIVLQLGPHLPIVLPAIGDQAFNTWAFAGPNCRFANIKFYMDCSLTRVSWPLLAFCIFM
jgi:hypothetical protein